MANQYITRSSTMAYQVSDIDLQLELYDRVYYNTAYYHWYEKEPSQPDPCLY